jgi:hypothetical protein
VGLSHTALTLQAAFKYLFTEEVLELQRLAQSLGPDPIVVNIGAGAGTSALAFCESRPDLWLVSVDVQEPSSPYGCLEGSGATGRRVLGRPGQQVLGASIQWGGAGSSGHQAAVTLSTGPQLRRMSGRHRGMDANLKPGGLLAMRLQQGGRLPAAAGGRAASPRLEGVGRAVRNRSSELERSAASNLITFRKPWAIRPDQEQ